MINKAKYFWTNENEDELHDNPEETTPLNLEAVWDLMQAYADQEVKEALEKIIIEIKCEQEFTHPSMHLTQNRFNEGLNTAIEIIKNTKI